MIYSMFRVDILELYAVDVWHYIWITYAIYKWYSMVEYGFFKKKGISMAEVAESIVVCGRYVSPNSMVDICWYNVMSEFYGLW